MPLNDVCTARFPDRLLVTSYKEDRAGICGGNWIGGVRDPGHPGVYVNANDRKALEEALRELPN